MILVEEVHTHEGNYDVHWHVTPPDVGQRHIITRQTWNDDYTIREVWEWQPVEVA